MNKIKVVLLKARYQGLIYENTAINCEYNGQSSTILSIITTTFLTVLFFYLYEMEVMFIEINFYELHPSPEREKRFVVQTCCSVFYVLILIPWQGARKNCLMFSLPASTHEPE